MRPAGEGSGKATPSVESPISSAASKRGSHSGKRRRAVAHSTGLTPPSASLRSGRSCKAPGGVDFGGVGAESVMQAADSQTIRKRLRLQIQEMRDVEGSTHQGEEALGVCATSIFHDIQQIEDSLLISHAVTPKLAPIINMVYGGRFCLVQYFINGAVIPLMQS